MALPVGITPTVVTAQFIGQDGTPATGTVTFTPSKATWVDDTTDKVILLPDPVIGTLDSTGTMLGADMATGVKLVPTDSSVVSPHGWTWDVAINVHIGSLPFTMNFSVSVTQSPSTVDLVNLAPVSADGSGGIKAVLKVNTKLPDSTGNVTLTAADVGALATAPVTSVNTKTGAVVLAASDVGAIATGAAVTTVNGHGPGAVTIQASDVNAVPVQSPVTLTDGATISTDVSTGRQFRVTLAGNHTLSAPVGSPRDGQTALWEFIQDATGGRTITLDSIFEFGTDVTNSGLSSAPNTHDFVGAIYDSTAAVWRVIMWIKGY